MRFLGIYSKLWENNRLNTKINWNGNDFRGILYNKHFNSMENAIGTECRDKKATQPKRTTAIVLRLGEERECSFAEHWQAFETLLICAEWWK